MKEKPKQAFTKEFTVIERSIKTPCRVCIPFDLSIPVYQRPKLHEFTGLWDTGASHTVISKNVVSRLGLHPTGFIKTFHAQGVSDNVPTYLLSIILPNSVIFPSLRVSEGDLNGCDLLIGMDIIQKGDFSVTCSKGVTKFSFQLPSTHDHDFEKEVYDELHTPAKSESIPRPNDPCPCGSEKKYKKCCGSPAKA